MIMDKFWPGPVTLVFEKKVLFRIPYQADLKRCRKIPSNKLARELINTFGLPVAATKCQYKRKTSPTKAEHVLNDMNGKIDMIIDGGSCDVGL